MATGGSLVVTMAFVTAASLSYQEETLASNKNCAAESSEMEIECNKAEQNNEDFFLLQFPNCPGKFFPHRHTERIMASRTRESCKCDNRL
jgi:hypothetical protein